MKNIEEQIPKESLELQGLSEIPEIRVRTFLICFFMDWNHRNTINSDGVVRTRGGKRRSIGDIYNIVTHYLDTDLKSVVRELIWLCKNIKGFRTSYCSTIQKRVYYYTTHQNNGIFDRRHPDEYDLRFDQWEELANPKTKDLTFDEFIGAREPEEDLFERIRQVAHERWTTQEEAQRREELAQRRADYLYERLMRTRFTETIDE